MTPASNSEAGAATVLLADIGTSTVSNTPIPKTVIKIHNKSGLRFTLVLPYLPKVTVLYGTWPYFKIIIFCNYLTKLYRSYRSAE
jgi:hypothetical protein